MLEEERQADLTRMLQDNSGLTTGTIVATALAAAVIAYALRRARQQEEERALPAGPAGAFDRARDLVGDERLEAGRDFVVEKLLPEFKPALLAIVKDLEKQTNHWFRQTEKAIKRM